MDWDSRIEMGKLSEHLEFFIKDSGVEVYKVKWKSHLDT